MSAKRKNKSLSYYRYQRPRSVHQSNLAKKIVLIVILLAAITVIIGSILSTVLTTENQVKATIDSIASDYYENYFYETLYSSPEFDRDNPGAILEEYQEKGLSTLALRDLLLYDDQRHYNDYDYLTKYCDINQTFIQFFPDPPYDKSSYHTKITYSCNF